jgi:hypothetical protein
MVAHPLILAGLTLLLGGALLFSATAFGLDFSDPGWEWRLPGEQKGAVSFRALDADGDGTLTLAEARVHPGVARNFVRADLNRDGRLSPLEFNNFALEASARQIRDSAEVSGAPL